jgi:FkbM family methyltransferase
MLKAAMKVFLRTTARALPWGAKQAILDGIVDNLDQFERFQQIGHGLGVESISVRGANGLVWGAISDKWLMGNYAVKRKWASDQVRLFQEFFSKAGCGGSFLDVGANVGLTLFPVAQNPQVQCFGFEPVPRNFAYLNLGLADNCVYKNVVLSQLALFDRKDTVKFELSSSNSGDHRVRVSEADGLLGEKSREVILVQADRLDDVIAISDLRLPLAVKIDTQGSEPNIFSGGENTLAAAELISLEFSPHSMRRIGGDVDGELRFLKSHFREGAIAIGEEEGAPRWRPMSVIVDELAQYWEDSNIGAKYFDVIVRK